MGGGGGGREIAHTHTHTDTLSHTHTHTHTLTHTAHTHTHTHTHTHAHCSQLWSCLIFLDNYSEWFVSKIWSQFPSSQKFRFICFKSHNIILISHLMSRDFSLSNYFGQRPHCSASLSLSLSLCLRLSLSLSVSLSLSLSVSLSLTRSLARSRLSVSHQERQMIYCNRTYPL